jgi:hypothetical protein
MNFASFAAEPGPAGAAISCFGFTPRQWWLVYGRGKFPLLYMLAKRIFCIPTSSASAERVWSVFSLIH